MFLAPCIRIFTDVLAIEGAITETYDCWAGNLETIPCIAFRAGSRRLD